jgi:RES domain-containing protein
VRLFRITRQRERALAFDGVGSSLYPGRWNERMRRIVYATSRIPLGILEILVQSSGAPLVGYVAYPLDVPDELLEVFDRSVLTPAWRSALAGRDECRIHGERWRAGGRTVGLVVPSAVVPEAQAFGDVNVVLNPAHADFARIRIERPIALNVDPRLQALVSPMPALLSGRRRSGSPSGTRKRR